MKRVRLVSLVAASVVTAIQWAAFFRPAMYPGSVPTVDGPVASEVPRGDSPVIVVAAQRESFFKY